MCLHVFKCLHQSSGAQTTNTYFAYTCTQPHCSPPSARSHATYSREPYTHAHMHTCIQPHRSSPSAGARPAHASSPRSQASLDTGPTRIPQGSLNSSKSTPRSANHSSPFSPRNSHSVNGNLHSPLVAVGSPRTVISSPKQVGIVASSSNGKISSSFETRSGEASQGADGGGGTSGFTAQALSDQELVAELQRRNLINGAKQLEGT